MTKTCPIPITVLLAVLAGLFVGCAGLKSTPADPAFSASSTGSVGISANKSIKMSQQGLAHQRDLKTPPQQQISPPKLDLGSQLNQVSSTTKKASNRNSFGASFRRVTRAVSAAITIKPKETPAKDPLRLSTKPGRIGPDLYVATARVYENQGQTVKATKKYKQALKVSPKDFSALMGLARLYHRTDNLNEAIRIYQQAVKAHPDNAVALNDLGLCYARQDKTVEAIKTLGRAVDLRTDSKLYRNNMATVLVQANRLEEAYAHLAYAHGEAIAHYNLGYLLQQQGGRETAARKHYRLALRASPSLTQAQKKLDQLSEQMAQSPPAKYDTRRLPKSSVKAGDKTSRFSTQNTIGRSSRANRPGQSTPDATAKVLNTRLMYPNHDIRRTPPTEYAPQRSAPEPDPNPDYLQRQGRRFQRNGTQRDYTQLRSPFPVQKTQYLSLAPIPPTPGE